MLKKFLIIGLSMAMSLSGLVGKVKAEIETINSDTVILLDSNTGYSSIVSTEYNYSTLVKYNIVENGIAYSIVVDKINGLFVVDNKVFTEKAYDDLTRYQIEDLDNIGQTSLLTYVDNCEYEMNLVDYDYMALELSLLEQNHYHNSSNMRCMFCPLQTTTVPSTNYSSQAIPIGQQSRWLQIALTTAAIVKVASFAFWDVFGKAKDFVRFLIDAVGATVFNAYVTYEGYQYYHSICPNAVKEYRIVEGRTNILGLPVADTTETYYFYTSKPF